MLSSKAIAEIINEKENLERIKEDKKRYEIYNGKVRKYVLDAITREFVLPETVQGLSSRIIPVNIIQKIVNKLAGLYIENPIREPMEYNDQDELAVSTFVEATELNSYMKTLNRMVKLCKHAALETFVFEGKPSVRVLPSHTYTPISDSILMPEMPTYFVKHITFHADKKKAVHIVWNDTEHYTMDGEGNILSDSVDGTYPNEYGVIPIVYVKETKDQLIPLSDDDLISMQIAINLLLTDLAFGTKYAAWSLIYFIGAKSDKISFNPNSVISLDYNKDGTKPEIGVIKPTLDIAEMLMEVEALLSLLLTTKSLSVSNVSMNVSSSNPASGVAKVLDQAESTEDKKDQIEMFANAEKELFKKLAGNIYPVWQGLNLIGADYLLNFTDAFKLSISYQDMAIVVSEQSKVDVEVKKLDNGLTSKRLSIQTLNPEMNDDQVTQLMNEIKQEQDDALSFVEPATPNQGQ